MEREAKASSDNESHEDDTGYAFDYTGNIKADNEVPSGDIGSLEGGDGNLPGDIRSLEADVGKPSGNNESCEDDSEKPSGSNENYKDDRGEPSGDRGDSFWKAITHSTRS